MAAAQAADPEPIEQAVDGRAVLTRGPRLPRALGPAPHQHDLANGRGEIPIHGLELGHPADAGGRLSADGPAVEGERALDARHGADDRPEEGRLARAARPDNADEGASPDRQVDVFQRLKAAGIGFR